MRTAVLLLFLLFLASFSAVAEEKHSGLQILAEISPPAVIAKEDGSLEGFGIEIVEAIQKELGSDFSVQVVPWARGYKILQNQPDVLLFPTTRTPEREDLFCWVGPIAHLDWILFGHKGHVYNINSLDDAKKVSGIGVYRGDARELYLRSKGFTNIQVVDDQYVNFLKLLRSRIGLVASSNIGVTEHVKRNKQLKDILVPVYTFKRAQLYLAFSQGTNPETLKRWRAAFRRLEKNGVVRKIQRKWY